jgi:hypothetical protein
MCTIIYQRHDKFQESKLYTPILWHFALPYCGTLHSRTVVLYTPILWYFTLPYCGTLHSHTVVLYTPILWYFTLLNCGTLHSHSLVLYAPILWYFTLPYCGTLHSHSMVLYAPILWHFTLPYCGTLHSHSMVLYAPILWYFYAFWSWFKVRWESTRIFVRALDKYGKWGYSPFCALSNLALNRNEELISRSGQFILGERSPTTHWAGSPWV